MKGTKIIMTKFIDIHVLQSIPAANLNRGENGDPKTVIYGGKLRSRVSSQSWKHAMREDFKAQTQYTDWLSSTRSKLIPQKIIDDLTADGMDEQKAVDLVTNALAVASIKVKAPKKGTDDPYTTDTLLMLSAGQIRNLTNFLKEHPDLDAKTVKKDKDSKAIKQALTDLLNTDNALDLALFGRMVAGDAKLNVDAASQVAHAFSINEIVPEFDFFTAVDDIKESQGAGMMGSMGYNTSTLYRYANLNVDELKHNLGDEELTEKGIKQFIKSFVLSMPTGKQNTYANKTLPQYVMVNVRDDTPVNLANAFEKPIKLAGGESGVAALEKQAKESEMFVDPALVTFVVTAGDSQFYKASSLSALIADVVSAL